MWFSRQLLFGVLCFTINWCGILAQDNSDLEWWEDSSLYHVYVRSFQDSNGDGIGDIKGVTSRLEYLKEIGITAIWLSPVFSSPMFDMGYDVSNYYEVDPLFGTFDDLKELIAKCKQLGIKILLDLVVNHSSIECEWFKKSVNSEEGYKDLYVWQDGKVDPNNSSRRLPPNNWMSAFASEAWEWNDVRQQFYLHQFFVQQADFNYRNPKANELMLDIFKFWLDNGVDGFRLDATNYLLEYQNSDGEFPDIPGAQDPDTTSGVDYKKNLKISADVLYVWREFMDNYTKLNGGDVRPLYSEAYGTDDFIRWSYGDDTHLGVQVPFNFDLVRTVDKSIKDLDTKSNAKDLEFFVNRWMTLMWNTTKTANWQVGNHDNARPPNRWGIKKTDNINMLIAGLPGISVTYYGEEIGMRDGDEIIDFRDGARTPMQWSLNENWGFSTNASTWLSFSKENIEMLNVQNERGTARSTLNIYKQMHKLKKTKVFKSFKKDNALQMEALNDNVFQIVRADPGKEEYRILLNFGNKLETLTNITNKVMKYFILNANSPHRFGDKVNLEHQIRLMPYEGVVLHWKA